MKSMFTLILSILLSPLLIAQLPTTNVYLMKMTQKEDDIKIKQVKKITTDNAEGYNNQPAFIGDELYMTVQKEGDDQTDIWAYNIKDSAFIQITDTKEKEYSPTPTPDNKHFSTVCVEQDGVTQRLWEYPLSRAYYGKYSFKDIKNIGYYKWINASFIAAFIVGKPHTLQIINTHIETTREIEKDIKRGLQTNKRGNLLYIGKDEEGKWMIKELFTKTYHSRSVIAPLEGSQDFVCTYDNILLMGQGSKLYKYKIGVDKTWSLVKDFAEEGITNITRIAVDDNGLLAIVNKKKGGNKEKLQVKN